MFEELEARLHAVADEVRGRHSDRAAAHPGGRIVREVVDPAFLRERLNALQDPSSGPIQLPHDVFQEADRELAEAVAERGNSTSTVPFMPHTATNSILQSLLTTCVESRAAEVLEELPTGVHRLAHAVITDAEIFRHYGPCDPRWVITGLAMGLARFHGKPPFPDEPAAPVHLADNARVLIVGDWGTGLRGAVAVGEQMRKWLDDAKGRERHVVHLGDVYYCGWREEYEHRFLRYWPVDPDEREILSWAIPGNHDMYSGGHGYYGFLLHDPRFRGQWRGNPAKQPPSSHFSIENDHWQVLGLDSCYAEHDLAGSQEQWLAEKLQADRRTMLLSHHQPVSAYVKKLPQAMAEKVQRALPAGRSIDAWFWGHEHRCTVYDHPAPYLQFGSCSGNGGVPLLLPDPPITPEGDEAGYAPATWAYAGTEVVETDRWLRFGFVALDFDGPHLQIRYIDEHNNIVNTVTLG